RKAYTSSPSRPSRAAPRERSSDTSSKRGCLLRPAKQQRPRPRDRGKPDDDDNASMTTTSTTHIGTSTPDDIVVRGKSLCRDLLGKLSFTEMICFQITGHNPSPAHT